MGRLLYLTLSRLDITYGVHKLSQFVTQPRTSHLHATHHMLWHLKTKPRQRIFFPSSSSLQLKAFYDADWGACPDSQRFITDFCVLIGDSLVSWKSKKQPTMSRSSAEAEYHAWLPLLVNLYGLLNFLKILVFHFLLHIFCSATIR